MLVVLFVFRRMREFFGKAFYEEVFVMVFFERFGGEV